MPTPWKSKHAQRSFSEVGSTPTAAKASAYAKATADKMVGRLGRGDPQTVIVGLPDALRPCSEQAAVKESPLTKLRVNDKDRVNTAIINSRLHSEAMPRHAGFEMPKDRLTINLAPADIKKEGPIFIPPLHF